MSQFLFQYPSGNTADNTHSCRLLFLSAFLMSPFPYFHRCIVRAVTRVRDGAALLCVPYTEYIADTQFIKSVSKPGLRSDSHGKHHVVAVRLLTFSACYVFSYYSAVLYRAQLRSGHEYRPVRSDALHRIIDQLEPCSRSYLVRHLNDGHLVAAGVEEFRRLEAGHTRAYDSDPAVFYLFIPEQQVGRLYDVLPADARYRARSQRSASCSAYDGIRLPCLYLFCRELSAHEDLRALFLSGCHEVFNGPVQPLLMEPRRCGLQLAAGFI